VYKVVGRFVGKTDVGTTTIDGLNGTVIIVEV
jgi:hypothetical protein